MFNAMDQLMISILSPIIQMRSIVMQDQSFFYFAVIIAVYFLGISIVFNQFGGFSGLASRLLTLTLLCFVYIEWFNITDNVPRIVSVLACEVANDMRNNGIRPSNGGADITNGTGCTTTQPVNYVDRDGNPQVVEVSLLFRPSLIAAMFVNMGITMHQRILNQVNNGVDILVATFIRYPLFAFSLIVLIITAGFVLGQIIMIQVEFFIVTLMAFIILPFSLIPMMKNISNSIMKYMKDVTIKMFVIGVVVALNWQVLVSLDAGMNYDPSRVSTALGALGSRINVLIKDITLTVGGVIVMAVLSIQAPKLFQSVMRGMPELDRDSVASARKALQNAENSPGNMVQGGLKTTQQASAGIKDLLKAATGG